MRLVEDDDGVFGDVLRHLLGDLRVEEVVEGVYHDVDERHLRRRAMGRRERGSGGGGGRTILRTVKYGQTPLSRPFCRTSASVHMPGGISWPASMSPRFYSGARSGLRATRTEQREGGGTHVVEAAGLDRARVVPRPLADGGVCEIAAARVDDLALFLLGHLPRARSEAARGEERRERDAPRGVCRGSCGW